MARRDLTFLVFRHDPYDPASTPRLQKYVLDETPRMTLFTVLTRIREEQDPSLKFDFVCRAAVCGSCAMLVNGRPRLACMTRTSVLPNKVKLLPMPFFRLVGDLSVDTGTWFRETGRRVQSWIESAHPFEPAAEEQRMSNEEAQRVYELDRCIECGVCLAACGAAQMRGDYLGATGLLRVARFLVDPRDTRSADDFFDVIGTDYGIFGCIGFLACDDYCPKDIPLAGQLAYLRRKLVLANLKARGDARHPTARQIPQRIASAPRR